MIKIIKSIGVLGICCTGFSLSGCAGVAGLFKPQESLKQECLAAPVLYSNLKVASHNREYVLQDGRNCTRIYHPSKSKGF